MSKLALGVISAVAAALLATLASAGMAAPSGVPFRGDAHMGKTTSTVSFRVAGGKAVDFQLDGLDVQQMQIGRGGRFTGCNTRAQAHPCVTGTLDLARDRASGTVKFGKQGVWQWSAHAVGAGSMRG